MDTTFREHKYFIYEDIRLRKFFIAYNKEFLKVQYVFLRLPCTGKKLENDINVVGHLDGKLNPVWYAQRMTLSRAIKESICETLNELTV